MKKIFAIPTLHGELTAHFGHCEKFAIVETVDEKVMNEYMLEPPIHEPGVYPRFLAEKGIHIIIAGGMGQKAQDLFAQNKIEVFMGVLTGTPAKLVEDYFSKQLQTGKNLCDH